MKHLLLRPQFGTFFRILPCRRSFLHSPKTVPSPELIHDTLKCRIEQAPLSTLSITPLLRHWCDCRNQPQLSELRTIISSLHRSNRFSHALQISEWMSEQKSYDLSSLDFETRLLLIAKLCGIDEAYKFFDTIPVEKRDFNVHNALLNCCKAHSSVSIAEAMFQKMSDLGLAANNPKPYNTMLSLYHEAENHDMVVKLLHEMDSRNMVPVGVPFAKLLSSYSIASVSDIQGMERFLNKWRKMMDEWATCYFPGLVYLQAGSKEKGLALLRRTEGLLHGGCRETIYGCLITLYCHVGEREDVHRLWNMAKKYKISFDSSKISDIIKTFTMKGGLDEVLEEWDEFPNPYNGDLDLQKRYVKEKADKAVNMLGKKESKWEALAHKFSNLVESEDDKEEERRKRVAEAMEGRLHDRWNPKNSLALSARACVQYVDGRRDIESAAGILRQLSRREQVLHAMDKARLSLKLVEAMRGGGYVGGED